MTSEQQAREYATDQMQQGKITVDQANVLIIQMMGAKAIVNKLPMSVRKALNNAVGKGELGRIKKDGLMPEVYHHKNGRARALELQRSFAKSKIEAISKVMLHHKDL